MKDKKILIMSVYAPSEYNEYWYALQKKFIKKHTYTSYDFKIITNDVSAELFDEDDVVQINKENIGHPAGIQQIFSYMREHADEYGSFLLLDSDSFPVRAGWHEILDGQMTGFDKTIAAPIRYENLDRFPHPCVVYLTKDVLEEAKINFDYATTTNLLGDEINEVGGLMMNMRSDVLPLLRTNRVNLHPVAAGIYHHLFYHHGAGSRGFDFRLLKKYQYYDHWIDSGNQPDYGEQLMNALISDPEGFIDKLMYAY